MKTGSTITIRQDPSSFPYNKGLLKMHLTFQVIQQEEPLVHHLNRDLESLLKFDF